MASLVQRRGGRQRGEIKLKKGGSGERVLVFCVLAF